MTTERAPVEVLKVSATSKPVAVAGAIAGVIRSKGRVEVQAIGAGAINQAVKAIAISGATSRRAAWTWSASPPSSTSRSTARSAPESGCWWRADNAHPEARVRARSFNIWTIGCQMNSADSESLARRLLAAGYVEDSLERADIGDPEHVRREAGVRGPCLLQAARVEGVEDA